MKFPLTQQQTFDIAYKGVVNQGMASFRKETDSCVYNGPNDTHCAAAFIFQETNPDFRLDERWDNAEAVFRWIGYDYDYHLTNLLGKIQGAHDTSARYAIECGADFIELYKSKMEKLADKLYLKVPSMTQDES